MRPEHAAILVGSIREEDYLPRFTHTPTKGIVRQGQMRVSGVLGRGFIPSIGDEFERGDWHYVVEHLEYTEGGYAVRWSAIGVKL